MRLKGLGLTAAFLLLVVCGFAGTGAPALAQAQPGINTATLPPAGPRLGNRSDLPRLLGDADARLYAEIFALQETGRWDQADALIRQIDDPVLMGHVKFQRYMHPTKYRSSYKELKRWMDAYADHPGAARVYRLAKKRQPKGWKSPKRATGVSLGAARGEHAPKTFAQRRATDIARAKAKAGKRSRAQRREIRQVQRQIRHWVANGYVTRSLKHLQSKRNTRLFDPISFDESLAKVAAGYFFWGKDQDALRVAERAAARSGEVVPIAHWWAGLAAWRLHQYDTAAAHFHALAASKTASAWSVTAGGYWASRAYLVGGRPERVNEVLRIAARYLRTFYGLMAVNALGLEPPLEWELPALNTADRQILLRMPAARRALALIQIGQQHRAETELRRFAGSISPQFARIMMALAAEAGLADVSYRTAEAVERRTGRPVDAALYPMPVWTPEGGFNLDRAFVYAVMRQESKFRASAKSPRGARGLMQLMPATAGLMARTRFRGARRNELLDPVLNVTLGERYLTHLLGHNGIDGNLFYAMTAYNGGPGNLKKWRRKADYRGDPLLYIESIPSRETRIFIERVLTNLWIYRYRMDQEPPSLEAVVSGDWPVYVPLDRSSLALAAHGN